MRNRRKAVFTGLFSVVCVAALLLAAHRMALSYLDRTAESINRQISFAHSAESGTSYEETLSLEQLAAYRGDYDRTSAQYYKNMLGTRYGSSGIAVYNAVLYALDHSYECISVPVAVCSDNGLLDAVFYAVYDHPMLEENSAAELHAANQTYYERDISRRLIYLPGNNGESLQYKKTALEKAEEIVSGMPEGDEAARAQYLYNWIVENVRYTEDENYNDANPHYLYDTFITGVTNCDGFSNAYTMLMNLAGIECFNVGDEVEEGEIGHTWNVLKLNGKYYHADPTAESSLYDFCEENCYLYFARSAEAVGNGAYEERIRAVAPPCTNTDRDLEGIDLYMRDEVLSGAETAANAEAVRELENGRRRVLIRCDAFPDHSWDENLETVRQWLSPCAVDLTACVLGDRYCAVYSGNRDFS